MRWIRGTTRVPVKRMAVAGVAVAIAASVPTAGSSAPAVPQRMAAAPLEARVLAPMGLTSAEGVAVGPDGTTYATEFSRNRVLALSTDGEVTSLLPEGIDGPQAIDVADDGTVAVIGLDALVVIAPDGTRTDRALPADGQAGDVAFDPSGVIHITEEGSNQVLQLQPDGSWTAIDFTTTGDITGLAIDEDDAISVIDVDRNDVVRRTPDGTETPAGFTGLVGPVALDASDGVTVVAQPDAVISRTSAGAQQTLPGLSSGAPSDVAIAPGRVLLSFGLHATGRVPPAIGGVLQYDDQSEDSARMPFGDLATIDSVSAGMASTVFFSSWSGTGGYSEPNPVRRIVGDQAPEDVLPASNVGMLIAAAPDGTVYRTSGNSTVSRIAADGTTTDVPLPTSPGMDSVTTLSVDETGRLFVALTSGYGNGAFTIVEPLATGGSKTWYQSDGSSEDFETMAAGGGTVQMITYSRISDVLQLRDVDPGGKAPVRAELGDVPVAEMDVDAGGVAFVITADGFVTVAADGTTTPFTYQGMGNPLALSIGIDRTLYVGDDQLGIVAVPFASSEPVDPTPGGAVPATPVPGSASYTG